ncbi:Ubiquitin carboxyl-terminal hydrolase 14 [Nymphon striatum]|nr:Ubiquitin carboxyl-terminal hydrolase 14 [Nymphon striatum]
MPQFKVKVKWGKELFKDVDVNTDEPPLVFKAQLFALSGVQPDRQKVMVKGTSLKDDDWDNFKLKSGAMVLMMGTSEELPKEPAEKPVFVEDMSENELASAFELPAGLSNLGNTCYLNATVQCLRTVPEIKRSLQRYEEKLTTASGVMAAQSITAALRDLYSSMDREATIPPIILVQMFHKAFPRFSEKSEHGGFVQQDANEFWTELMRMLKQKLKSENETGSSCAFIDQYFGGTFDVTLKCTEAEDELEKKSTEDFLQLSCFISQDVKYLQSGLLLRMEDQLTKHSPTLDKDALYKKVSKISRLPSYLTVQFVRFYYKEKEAINAKILKGKKGDKTMEKKDSEKKTLPFSFSDDEGSNNSGYYQLQAVLTHKGRSSSSGHYVAWIRRKKVMLFTDEWVKCDDDKISLITSEEILKLSGGGDWHCAYVLLYGPRIYEFDEDEGTKMDTS